MLSTCLAAVGLFGSVLLLGNALKDLLGPTLTGQIPLATFFKLMGLLVPYVAAYALPMGVLTGVLLVLGRMSAQHEITAMRAAGLSLGFIARPILVLGLLGTAASLVVNFEHMPRARTAYKEIFGQAVQRNPLSFIVPKTFVREFPGVVLYVGAKDGSRLRDFWVWQFDEEGRVRVFARADEGDFQFEPDTNTLVLTLRNVVMESRNERDPEDFTRPLTTSAVGEFPVKLQLDHLFGRQVLRRKVEWLTFTQLTQEWRRLGAAGDDAGRMRVAIALHDKASTAVAVLAFAVIAIPLGIRVSRKETSANLGVALLLVMLYYFLTNVIKLLHDQPALRPDLLLWLPAAGFLVAGVWMFRRIGRV